MPVLKNPQHEKFCMGVAKGLSATKAYIKAGYKDKVASAAACRLYKNTSIRARVEELAGKFEARTVKVEQSTYEQSKAYEIAIKLNRIGDYDDIRTRIRMIMAERAADPTMANVPGGKSGMLVRQWKTIQITDDRGRPKVVQLPEYSFDAGLANALLAYHKQAGIELGQWSEKRDVKLSGTLDLSVVDEIMGGLDMQDELDGQLIEMKALPDSDGGHANGHG